MPGAVADVNARRGFNCNGRGRTLKFWRHRASPSWTQFPARLNGPLSSLPLLLGAPRWEFFSRREMVQRMIEATEKSFNEGLLGSAVVSVAVVAAILAVAL